MSPHVKSVGRRSATRWRPATVGGAVAGAIDLSSGAPGTTITGSLGPVMVIDLRGADPASWVAGVSSTDFTATGVPAIPATRATYTPSAPSNYGSGVLLPDGAGPLGSTARAACTYANSIGVNPAKWTPAVAVAHSVA